MSLSLSLHCGGGIRYHNSLPTECLGAATPPARPEAARHHISAVSKVKRSIKFLKKTPTAPTFRSPSYTVKQQQQRTFPVAGHLSGKKHVKSHLGTAWLLAWRRALVLSSFVFPSSPGTERTCRGLKARACYALKRKAGFGPHKKLHFNPQTN